jgi:diguanylate cyclase (GGDEF)-like protein
MSPVAAVRDAVVAKSPEMSPTVIGPAVVAGVVAALLVLAGAMLGLAAMALGVPAGLAAIAVKRRIEARQEGLKLLSQQDALTGLGNRRLLHERLRYEIARHRRHGRRFSLLALDLDGFKQVNDRFGHPAGDEILKEVARSMERAVRDQDTVVRVGGDEFCILVPESSWADADHMAERCAGRSRARSAARAAQRQHRLRRLPRRGLDARAPDRPRGRRGHRDQAQVAGAAPAARRLAAAYGASSKLTVTRAVTVIVPGAVGVAGRCRRPPARSVCPTLPWTSASATTGRDLRAVERHRAQPHDALAQAAGDRLGPPPALSTARVVAASRAARSSTRS